MLYFTRTNYLAIMTVLFITSNSFAADTHEFLLVSDLLNRVSARGYAASLSLPSTNHDQPFKIFVESRLNEIQQVNVDEQSVQIRLDMQLQWTDPELTWDPAAFGELNVVRLPADTVWTPDVASVRAGEVDKTLGNTEKFVHVFSDGTVLFRPSIVYIGQCNIDVTNFPFDEQTCYIEFATWSYSADRMKILPWAMMSTQSGSEVSKLSFYNITNHYTMHQSPNWKLITWKMFSYTESSEGSLWPVSKVLYQLCIERKNTLYSQIIIVPTVLLGILSLTIFLIPLGDSGRLDFGLNILLSFFVLLTMVADNLPPAQDNIPKIGKYLCGCLSLLAISIAISAILNKCYEFSQKGRPFPKCSTKVCFGLKNCAIKKDRSSEELEAEEGRREAGNKSTAAAGTASKLPLVKKKPKVERVASEKERKENSKNWEKFTRWANRICFILFIVAHLVGIVLVFFI